MPEYKVHYTVNELGYPEYGDVRTEDITVQHYIGDIGTTTNEKLAKFFSVCHYLDNPDISSAVKEAYKQHFNIAFSQKHWADYYKWLTMQPIPIESFDTEETMGMSKFVDPFKDEIDPTTSDILSLLDANFSADESPIRRSKGKFPGVYQVRYSVTINNIKKNIEVGIVNDPNLVRIYAACHYLENKDIPDAKKEAYKTRIIKGEISPEWFQKYHTWLQEKPKPRKYQKRPITPSSSGGSSESASSTSTDPRSPKRHKNR